MSRDNRKSTQAREISIETNINLHAEGSVLVKFGNTHVICTASIDNNVPRWMKGSDKGWVTAEYGMLPRSTNERMGREAARGKQSGRTQEIQRLIKRSRFTIDETISPKSFSSSAFAEIFDEPFSCRSRPTSIIFGLAPIDFIFSIDSLAAVPAEITSSMMRTLPEGSWPIISPPSP